MLPGEQISDEAAGVTTAAAAAAAVALAAASHSPPSSSVGAKPGAGDLWLGYADKARSAVLAVLSLTLFVVAWHFLTENRIVFHIRFLNVPTPTQVLEKAQIALGTSQYFTHVLISSRRIFFGFIIAAVIAVPLGLIMGRSRWVRELVFPITEAIRPIPAIAWVPMAIMLWPTNEQSIVFITFLGSFFPILLNTLHGVSSVDPVLERAARSLGASQRALFLEVYFPAALPHIFTGMTIGMGVAWVSLIAAEMISGQFGVGYFTWEAYSLIQYADIVLGMITIGILGLISSAIVRVTGHLCMPWVR